MTSEQAAKLCVYVLHRHGRTVCATPIEDMLPVDARTVTEFDYGVDLHLVGSPHHITIGEWSRSAADNAVNALWDWAFPTIPK